MRFWSTPQSVHDSEITALAIIETGFAVSFYIWLTITLDSYVYLLIPVCISPLLLLRTEESTTLGLEWYKSVVNYLNSKLSNNILGKLPHLIKLFIFLAAAMMSVFPIKVIVTIRCLFQNPIGMLKMIPGNLYKVALSIDMHHPPEILPGAELSSRGECPRFPKIIGSLTKRYDTEEPRKYLLHYKEIIRSLFTLVLLIIILPLLIFGYLPALFYRWSLKATSIVYFPLVWVIHSTISDPSNKSKLIDQFKLPIERLRRTVSWGVIILLNVIPYLFYTVQLNLSEKTIQLIDASVLKILIHTYTLDKFTMQWWHVASLFNASITLILYYLISSLRILDEYPWKYGAKLCLSLRVLLSFYVIACGIILMLSAELTFPNIVILDQLLPIE